MKEQTLVERMVKQGVAQNVYHAAGLLNKLECGTLESDEERLARCRLYKDWQKYYVTAQAFTNEKAMKDAAKAAAIRGDKVPALLVEAK